MTDDDGLPEYCLICTQRPTDGEPVCDVCLQNAGAFLEANAELIGAASDLLHSGWALTEAVRDFIRELPHGELPVRLLEGLVRFDAALRKANGNG